MTTWVDRIQTHGVFAALSSTESLIEAVEPLTADVAIAVSDHDRVRQVVAVVRRTLEGMDPNLCPPSALEPLNSSLSQVQQSLASYQNSPQQTAHLHQANAYADALLTQMLAVPTVRDDGDARGIREAITGLRQSVSQHLRYLGDEVAGLSAQTAAVKEEAQALTTEIEKQTGRLDTALTTQQGQFSTAQEARSSEFAQTQSARATQAAEDERARATEHTKAQTTRQQATTTLLNKHRHAFDEALAAQRDEFQQLLNQAGEARDEAQRQLAERSHEHLEALAEERRRAEELVGLIGQTGMVHGFQRVADEERHAARTWNRVATMAFVGLIVCAALIFLPTLEGAFTWEMFVGRVYVSLTFGALAGFAARQAHQHQQVERRSRQMELEIASLGPFLAPLPETDRHVMLRQIADRMFAQKTAAGTNGSEPSVPVGTFANAIKDVARAALRR